ncbi:MAG: hypothetical protein M1822_008846 [Bathelium mastoideum]|nr:MAG: hypothetical protein M1822_008846 [Bathelium mastoideum]
MHQRLFGAPLRIGCLTSPHLTDVRERIRVNSKIISEASFAQYFWELWDKIQYECVRLGLENVPLVPGYPGLLTLLTFYTFVQEKVDVAIIETGIGGERDSTNIINRASATGITSLGLDHVEILGHTIENIAWHKAGIFKPGSPAFTVAQQVSALEVLRQRSYEKRVAQELHVVPASLVDRYQVNVSPDMTFQKLNASLAIALSEACLKELNPTFQMTAGLAKTIEDTRLPGRCETMNAQGSIWLLNTAHNEMSVAQASIWYRRTVSRPEFDNKPLVLLFNHESHRDGKAMLRIIHERVCGDGMSPSHTIFSADRFDLDNDKPDLFDSRYGLKSDLEVQKGYAKMWEELNGPGRLTIVSTVTEAVKTISDSCRGSVVVVAGSSYLAGAVRYILGLQHDGRKM